jgi:uncharacterized membrane protein
MILILLFVILVAATIWYVVHVISRGATANALEEVRVRYARGDITREQYLAMLRDLGAAPPA